jgi:septal ring factor EnvC (AmiA/AmiB activator)
MTSQIENLEKSLKEKIGELQNTKSEFDRASEKLRESEKRNKDFMTTVEENIKAISYLEDEKNDLVAKLESKSSILVRNFDSQFK